MQTSPRSRLADKIPQLTLDSWRLALQGNPHQSCTVYCSRSLFPVGCWEDVCCQETSAKLEINSSDPLCSQPSALLHNLMPLLSCVTSWIYQIHTPNFSSSVAPGQGPRELLWGGDVDLGVRKFHDALGTEGYTERQPRVDGP